MLTSVVYDGESWTQKSAEFSPIIDSTIDEYKF